MGIKRQYIAWNAATAALTAFPTAVSTGTSLKTMLQLKSGKGDLAILEWGYSFDVAPTALVKVELITTGTVAATSLTALSANDVRPYGDAGDTATSLTFSTSTSGFTAGAEGTITSTRFLDGGHTWAQQYSKQFPLDREPSVVSGDYLRIRMTTATAINALCYIVFEE